MRLSASIASASITSRLVFHGILFAPKAGAVWTVAVQRSDNRQLLHLAQKARILFLGELLVVRKKNVFLHIVHYLLTRR